MSLMNKLRKSMPAVVIFLIVMFVLLIIFEWGTQGRTGNSRSISGEAIGSVNGQDISASEFETRVKEMVDQQRESNPNGEIDEEQIRSQVWDQIISEELIAQEADKLGISVSDEELTKALLHEPPDFLKKGFTDSTGYYNEGLYQKFMTNMDKFLNERKYPQDQINKIKKQVFQAQEFIRKDRLRAAVEAAISSSVVPSVAAARAEFNDKNSKASGNYAFLDAALISDAQTNVKDDDAKKYFEAHKTEYTQKASREGKYIQWSIQPSAQDSASAQRREKTFTDALANMRTPKEKDSLFNEYSNTGKYDGTTYTPLQDIPKDLQPKLDSAKPGDVFTNVPLEGGNQMILIIDVKDTGETFVRAKHILIKTEGRNEDSCKQVANKILAEIKSGKNFDELAKTRSEDPGSGANGGDLGYFKKGQMVKPFEESAFSLPVGAMSGLVKSQFGYHIIKVVDKSSKSFKLRSLKFNALISNFTKSNLRRKADEVRARLEKGENIDSLASKEKLAALETGSVNKLQPTAGSMKLTQFIMNHNVGSVSDVIDLKDGNVLVAVVTKVKNEGLATFEDVKEQVLTKVRMSKKLDMLKERADKLGGSVVVGDTVRLKFADSSVEVKQFKDLSKSAPLPTGPDPVASNVIFTSEIGKISQAIRGEKGYYIILVSNRTEPSEAEFNKDKDKLVKENYMQRKSSVFQSWMAKARENAKINDNRNMR